MFELVSNDENYFMHEGSVNIPLKRFSDYKNHYSGSVFLMASGGSAAEFPVSRYADFPFIAMNGSVLRFVDEKIQPFFYICSDPDFPRRSADVAKLACERAQHIAMDLASFSNIHAYDKTILPGKSLYLLERVNGYYNKKNMSNRRFAWLNRKDPDLLSGFSLFFQKPNRIGFSKDMGRGSFCGRTVVYVALQLVYTLGFQNIFIVGMDLNKNTGRFYDKSGDGLPTAIDIDYYDYILPSFQFLSKKVLKVQENFRVFNLSLNSRLPDSVIPKITLDQLDQLLSEN